MQIRGGPFLGWWDINIRFIEGGEAQFVKGGNSLLYMKAVISLGVGFQLLISDLAIFPLVLHQHAFTWDSYFIDHFSLLQLV